MQKLSKRNFVLLVAGQFISLIGDRISHVVFITLVASLIGSQGSWSANVVFIVQMIPLFLFGYFFGSIIDTYSKRNLMIYSDMLRAFAILIVYFYTDNLYVIFMSIFLIGTGYAMFEPSRKAILPYLIPENKIVSWNKIYASLEIVAVIIGLAVGAFLLQLINIKTAILLDFTTYMVSIILLYLISYREFENSLRDKEPLLIKRSKEESHVNKLKEGITYIRKNNNVKFIFVLVFFHYFASVLFFTLLNDYSISTVVDLSHSGSLISYYVFIVSLGVLFAYPLLHFLKSLKDYLVTYLFLFFGIFLSILAYLFFTTNLFNSISYFFEIYLFSIGIVIGGQYLRLLYLFHLCSKKAYLGRIMSVYELLYGIIIAGGFLFGTFANVFIGYAGVTLICLTSYILCFLILYFNRSKISW